MFNIGDYVVYERFICQISDIKDTDYRTYGPKKFYVLKPINDLTTTINIPFDKNSMRAIISKEKALELIEDIPNIEMIEAVNDRMLEGIYRNLIHSNDQRDWIKIIKKTYLRNHSRELLGKKMGEKDCVFFNLAENLLYGEFALSLGMTYDETKEYIIKKVEGLSE